MLTAFVASSSAAQESTEEDSAATDSTTRGFFYASGGIGYGSESQTCTGVCTGRPSSVTGTAGYIGIGVTIDQRWRIGLEADLFNSTNSGYKQSLSYYSLMVSYYPNKNTNLWIKGGVGYAENHVGGVSSNFSTTTRGLSSGLGVGYDLIPKDWQVAFIPYVMYQKQFSGEEEGGTTFITALGSVFQIGIGVGYRH